MSTLRPKVELFYLDPDEFMVEVRELLGHYGISQKALARAARIQPQHMSKYVRGAVAPSLRTMHRIYDALTDLMNRKTETGQ